MLYNSLVFFVLTYGSETWNTTERDKKKLDAFQTRCLSEMLRIRWPEKISNEEPLRRTGTSNVSDKIANRKWETIGHVLRMDNNRIGTTTSRRKA